MSLYKVPQNIEKLNDLEKKLELLKDIKRSFSVFRIDCGSCNGCEIEVFAAISPMWDPERFGFKLVANPRHADILLCSGPVTRQMYYPLLRAYEAAPDPKIVVALGACGSSGGIFYDAYSTWSGIDKLIPVDVYIPGCPPHPASILYGLATALGILDQKLEKAEFKVEKELVNLNEDSLIGDTLFERDLSVHSKRLMSYVFGRKLYEIFIEALKESGEPKNPALVKKALEDKIRKQSDPRYAQCLGILYNEIYLRYVEGGEAMDLDEIWD